VTAPALPEVRVLLFDVFGTVVDWRSGVARDVRDFAARIDRHDIDPFAFADAWRSLYSPAMEEVRSGRRGFVRLDVLHRENLDRVLDRFEVERAVIAEEMLEELNRAWHRLDPWPDAIGGLTRLRRRFVIAPLSNGNIALLLNMAKRARLPWDAVLGAEVVQAYKPASEAYLRTVDLLQVTPGQACLVAAHNSDLAAARSCGLKTAYVPRPDEYGAGRRSPDPSDRWDVIAADFLDLADRLGA
jgi:2-haloacid dehalogenase